VRNIEKTGVLSDSVVFADDGVVLEGHKIVMEGHHPRLELEVSVVKGSFLHGSRMPLFIIIFITAGGFEMGKKIVFIIGIERAHERFLIVHLAQGKAVFFVFKMLTFKRGVATPSASQAAPLSIF
jgi:hypothetical protein